MTGSIPSAPDVGHRLSVVSVRPEAARCNAIQIAADRQRRYASHLREHLDESRRKMPMIAAFSVGLFYISPKAHFKTAACEFCYESVVLLSGIAVWIKQN